MTKPLLFFLLTAALVACAPVAQPPTDAPAVQDIAPATPAEPELEEEAADEDEGALEALLRRHNAVYEVEARQGPSRERCSANVTFRDGGETRQFVEVAASGEAWRYGVDAQPGSLLYLSAQTNCDGEVIARLYIDGELFRQASNGGRFAVARVRRVY